MLWINTMKIYTCILFFITQIVFTQATCISKTATKFDNNCYELFTNAMNWTEAKRSCSNFIGTRILAKVSSPSVLRYFNSIRPSYTQVWLGGNDRLKEGEWLWTDGTKANLTTMWGYREPNDMDGNEDCLEIFVDGTLNDDDCARPFSFICMEVNETITTSKTDTTTSLTSITSTAAIGFTTVRNESKPGNVSDYTLEKMNSLGLAEGIGIGTGIGIVVTLLLLAVVLAIMFCCKTKSVNGNLEKSGNSTNSENQTKLNTACGKITGTEGDKQVELNLYATVLDLQEQNTAYDNMTQTKAGSVRLVEPKETKHLYAEFLNKQGGCYINS